MTLTVIFQSDAAIGSLGTQVIGRPNRSEKINSGATGALGAVAGEIAILVNTGTSSIDVAHGSTPNASATSATDATSSFYSIPPGGSPFVRVQAGDKFAVA